MLKFQTELKCSAMNNFTSLEAQDIRFATNKLINKNQACERWPRYSPVQSEDREVCPHSDLA